VLSVDALPFHQHASAEFKGSQSVALLAFGICAVLEYVALLEYKYSSTRTGVLPVIKAENHRPVLCTQPCTT
jgi:hypothetical protein